MRTGLGRIGEKAGGFEHNVYAQVAPGDLGRVALGKELYLFAVVENAVFIGRDLGIELAIDRVVAEQQREGAGREQVIDADDFDLIGIMVNHCLERLAANASETVNANLDRHGDPLSLT